MLSVVSANVNGIRAAVRRGGLSWLATANPDIVTLQEVRAGRDHLDGCLAETAFADWHVSYAPSVAAGRNGVGVLTRVQPVDVRIGLERYLDDGRWIEVDIVEPSGGQLTVVSAYVFTGSAGMARQREKFRFLTAMQRRMAELEQRAAAGEGEALVTGDLNVAHRDVDLKNWLGNRNKAGFLPRERAYFDRWLGYGFDADRRAPTTKRKPGAWVDLVRKHGGDGPGPYTWWTWRGQAFDTDAGWRIDYQLATRGLAERSRTSVVGRAPSYAERWSDHAPVHTTFE